MIASLEIFLEAPRPPEVTFREAKGLGSIRLLMNNDSAGVGGFIRPTKLSINFIVPIANHNLLDLF